MVAWIPVTGRSISTQRHELTDLKGSGFMITNPKIEKKKAEVAKTETLLAEVKAKLREKKQELLKLENDEIVAMFRKEIITEVDYALIMKKRREAEINDEDGTLTERSAESSINNGGAGTPVPQ